MIGGRRGDRGCYGPAIIGDPPAADLVRQVPDAEPVADPGGQGDGVLRLGGHRRPGRGEVRRSDDGREAFVAGLQRRDLDQELHESCRPVVALGVHRDVQHLVGVPGDGGCETAVVSHVRILG
ncbi:hypothetical protein ACIQMV_33905 [Streptomyces sp. NPDC091412]|uniref:hypothetical protein n=1 Tax=Streptomyces sp. NPDC091412 TaxID=3366002 RepID=UPI0038118E63